MQWTSSSVFNDSAGAKQCRLPQHQFGKGEIGLYQTKPRSALFSLTAITERRIKVRPGAAIWGRPGADFYSENMRGSSRVLENPLIAINGRAKQISRSVPCVRLGLRFCT